MVKAAVILMFLLWGPTCTCCFAALSLSVNPIDGSNTLRFEGTYAGQENKKEIHIRVTSTAGERYEVFQRVLEPMINEKGEALNLQAINSQTVPNSNTSGTLYLQNSDNVGMGDQLLYSSSPSGESDSFIIGYALNPSLANSGTFTGRLIFTVRGIGTASNDQAIIDVFMVNHASNFKLAVQGGHNPAQVHVRASDTSLKTADYITVSFSGNPGQEIRVYQQVDGLPENETGEELGLNVLQLDTEGQTEGLRSPGLNSFSPNRSLVYSSSKAQDNFVVYFLTNAAEAQQQDAGTYVGKMTYIVETGSSTQAFPINMEFDVPPVFTMSVTTPPGGVNFSHVLAGSPPQDEEVVVTVASNLHKPYQVLQGLETNMTNSQGKEFNSKYFTLEVEIPQGQKGHSDFTEFSPVQTGEYPVFSSDAGGSGSTFKVLYRLQGYAQMSPGNFLTPIRYSLEQK